LTPCYYALQATLLVGAFAPASAQDPRLAARFPNTVAVRLTSIVDSAGHDGLPTEPLVLRALEGQAKSASTDQIVAAMNRLRGALQVSRRTLGADAPGVELTTAAAALQAGVAESKLAELHQLRGGMSVTVPLSAYLDLTSRGAPPDQAWDRISALAKRHANDADFGRLTPIDAGAKKTGRSGGTPVDERERSPAQARFETGGGASQLDQLTSSPLTSFSGGADARFGIAHFSFDGSRDDHIGVGVAGAMNGALRAQLHSGAWQIEVGPSVQAGRDIGSPWARSGSLDVSAVRDLGMVTMRGGLQMGMASARVGHATFYRPNFAADIRFGNFTFSPSWQSVAIHDSSLAVRFVADTINSERDTTYQARFRDVRDVGFGLKWASGRLSISGHLTQRFGTGVVAQTWWDGAAALRLTPIVSLTMKSGRIASEPVLGLRGGNYTTLGLRMDILQRAPVRDLPDLPDLADRAVVERLGPESVRLRFTLPSGVRVATLVSDLTEWRAVALSRTDDGRWELVLAAKSGVHRVNIRTDDGPWRAPPGLPATDDGFGAMVGLLVIDR